MLTLDATDVSESSMKRVMAESKNALARGQLKILTPFCIRKNTKKTDCSRQVYNVQFKEKWYLLNIVYLCSWPQLYSSFKHICLQRWGRDCATGTDMFFEGQWFAPVPNPSPHSHACGYKPIIAVSVSSCKVRYCALLLNEVLFVSGTIKSVYILLIKF